MARPEARVLVSIWDDADFIALDSDAQRAYMFLLSQADLAYSGVIPLRVRRWAQKTAGMTVNRLAEALQRLERTRFVVIDPDTEELLVRSLVRGDGVWRQPNLLRAARKHIATVESSALLGEIRVELERIVPIVDGKAKHVILAELEGMLEDLAGRLANPPANPPPKGSPDPSGNPSARALGEGGVVTAVTTGFPYPPSPEPLAPSPPPPKRPLASLARSPDPLDFDRFWGAYPRHQAKAAARRAWAKAIRRADPEAIIAGAARYGADPGRDPAYTAHASTWLNADRWDDEPLPRGSPNGRPSPGLVEVEGLRLKPEAAARLADRARFEAMDRANDQPAIEGPT